MGKNYYLKDRDILDQALEHSWGKSAEAKAKERAYNREYYQRHKEELLRKARQAGEGIQRTAQNAYDAVRNEASALSRAASSPHARSRVNEGNPSLNAYKRPRFSDEQITNWANYATARRNMNAARNTPGEAATQRELARRANRLSSTSTAINERAKDASQYGPEARFDSKLIRDAQNAYSKVRGKGREAKRELDSAMTKARSTAEDVYNKARSTAEDAGRYLEKTYKDAQTRSQQRKQAKGYKLMSDLSAIPQKLTNRMIPDRNERNEYYRNNPDTRAELSKLGQYRRQYGTAANEAAKASMTRAQKEALRKREEAKRRMQKWFKR